MSTATITSRPIAVAQTAAAPRARANSLARWVWCASGVNLAIVLAVLFLIFVVSERWWVAAAITYLPRSPWLLPGIVLGAVALAVHRPSVWVNVVAVGLVAGPIMELRIPGVLSAASLSRAPSDAAPLRFVSCNVQAYQPNFAEVLQEVAEFKPDVVVLQEAFGDHPLLNDFFPDWHRIHVASYYWVGSRYPLRLVAQCPSEVFNRAAGILVEVQTPGGPVMVASVHQMTARRGLREITPGSVLRGEAGELVNEFRDRREFEAAEIRLAIEQHRGDLPLIVAGDFNTPTSSHLFQQTWGDLQSAFDVAGWGYGYTSPSKPHRFWFSDTPWARIDHILCSPEWTVLSCQVGRRKGSDHRVVTAELLR